MDRNDILKTSYLNQKEAANKFNNAGYKYDENLSSNDAKVFVDENGKPNIAFRGTKPRFKDYVSDLALLTGLEKYDTRFKESQRITQLVKDKYGKEPDVYGHSLGGALAEKSGSKGNIITDNKGVGVAGIGRTVPKNQQDYRNKNDFISLLSLTQKHKYNNLNERKTKNRVTDILGNHKI
jgi:hypothetical protein